MNRTEPYWNRTYMDYWMRRCAEAEAAPLDPRHPPALLVFRALFSRLRRRDGESVLDVGVGFGRMLPVYVEYGLSPEGVDISEDMVRQAKADYPDIQVQVADGATLPYRDAVFDLLVCWGTFETFRDQRRCLHEFARVLKAGGRMLITGKNRDYPPDDREAAIAEQRALEKGHPNYFTRYDDLLAWADELRLVPYEEYFFQYRGDLSQARCYLVRLPRFYEYCILLHK